MTRPQPLVRQRGTAILMAMLTVVLVAAFAVAALWQQWRSVEVETAERARVQASWILTGALDWARLILREDAISGKTDHLAEPWAVPLEEARLSTFLSADKDNTTDAAAADDALQAFLSGRINDLQARLNVYNLLASKKEDAELAYKQFAKLFELLGLSQQELAALAENLRFAADNSPDNRSAARAPLLPQRFAELVWCGLSPTSLAALEPFVVVLPPDKLGLAPGALVKLNINTAPEEVLYAAVESLDKAGAKKLVSAREQKFFATLADVDKVTDHLSAKLPGSAFDVQTQVFEVLGRLRLEHTTVQERSVVLRTNSPPKASVLWRERGAIDLPAALGLPAQRP
jgi:general secretion pathway protein K